FIIGGGIPALIKIHRAREVIHPIRLSQCYSPCEQGQRTENRNDCHEYCFHGSLLSSFNRRVSTPMELERHVLIAFSAGVKKGLIISPPPPFLVERPLPPVQAAFDRPSHAAHPIEGSGRSPSPEG